LQERLNDEGVTRVRFRCPPGTLTSCKATGGWCSVETKGGDQILVLTMKDC
jgi:hypothetical protein